MMEIRMGRKNPKIKITGHADNGGEHRRAIGRRGATYDIYAQLKRNGFPDGFQVLCRNCNWIKETEKRSQRRCNTLNPSTTKEAVNG